MEKLSDRDYRAERKATINLQIRNNQKINTALNKKPVVKDLSKKLIFTNFLSKNDKNYQTKHMQTLASAMTLSNKRDASKSEIDQGILPQLEDTRSQSEKQNDKILQQQIAQQNCRILISDPTESNILFNMLNQKPHLLGYFNDHFPEIKNKFGQQSNIKGIFVENAVERLFEIEQNTGGVNDPLQTKDFLNVFPPKELLLNLLDILRSRPLSGPEADGKDKIEAWVAGYPDTMTPEQRQQSSLLGFPPKLDVNMDLADLPALMKNVTVESFISLDDITQQPSKSSAEQLIEQMSDEDLEKAYIALSRQIDLIDENDMGAMNDAEMQLEIYEVEIEKRKEQSAIIYGRQTDQKRQEMFNTDPYIINDDDTTFDDFDTFLKSLAPSPMKTEIIEKGDAIKYINQTTTSSQTKKEISKIVLSINDVINNNDLDEEQKEQLVDNISNDIIEIKNAEDYIDAHATQTAKNESKKERNLIANMIEVDTGMGTFRSNNSQLQHFNGVWEKCDEEQLAGLSVANKEALDWCEKNPSHALSYKVFKQFIFDHNKQQADNATTLPVHSSSIVDIDAQTENNTKAGSANLSSLQGDFSSPSKAPILTTPQDGEGLRQKKNSVINNILRQLNKNK